MAARDVEAVHTGERELVATRMFDAPRDRVWEVWTQPDHIARWWGPKGFSSTIHQMEVRSGGKWIFVMHGPDGTDYRNEIVYDEVQAPERLVYTHGPYPRFQVTVTLEAAGEQTRLTMRMVFESASEREKTVKTFNAEEGLKQTMGRLGEHLAEVAGMRPIGPVLELTRTFDAPVALVFEAWTKVEHFERWFAPREMSISECELDARPGGILRFIHRGPDGMTAHLRGAFREVFPARRLVFVLGFTDAQGRPVAPFADWPLDAVITTTVTFEPRGERTHLTIQQGYSSASTDSRAFQAVALNGKLARIGWDSTLERLGELLAQVPA